MPTGCFCAACGARLDSQSDRILWCSRCGCLYEVGMPPACIGVPKLSAATLRGRPVEPIMRMIRPFQDEDSAELLDNPPGGDSINAHA